MNNLDLTPFAIAIVVAVGLAAYWSNPRSRINVMFLVLSGHTVLWLFMLHLAFSVLGRNGVRLAVTVGAYFPVTFWFVAEAIVGREARIRALFWKCRWWILASTFLAILSNSEYFLAWSSPMRYVPRGWGYYVYVVCDILLLFALMHRAHVEARRQIGVKRVELELLLVGGGFGAAACLVLMALAAIFEMPLFAHLQPLVVVAIYSGVTISMIADRVFDARELLITGVQKIIVGLGMAAGAFGVLQLLLLLGLQTPAAFIATAALGAWTAAPLNKLVGRWFELAPDPAVVRQAVLIAARQQTDVEGLRRVFRSILNEWLRSDHGLIIWGSAPSLTGDEIELTADAPVVVAMRKLRWVTPERLARSRPIPEDAAVRQFLVENDLALLVCCEGVAHTILVGSGPSRVHHPFTYPVVTQLLEVASLMDGCLERIYFSMKAQHAEQLATIGLVGASLAHEIRNPLVSIRTFFKLLPEHHADAAFCARFIGPMTEEVARIEQLTTQLLELAAPRVYQMQSVGLHSLLTVVTDLLTTDATAKGVRIRTEFGAISDQAFIDGPAAKQVILNLCINAMQAAESAEGERWIKISTQQVNHGVEVSIADSGRGILPAQRPRLFQPFQSTKPDGLGLGLAVCREILNQLHAAITVDPYDAARGATFRIIFPASPLTSSPLG